MKKNKESLFTFLTFILCSFIAAIFALLNKFPLVYSDTGTYIVSGCEFELPFDRPVFYGLFLRATSLKLSLWLTILAQALVSVFLIRELIIYLVDRKRNTNLITILAVLILSSLSSYSYTASEVIADIFTAYIILCIVLWQNHNLSIVKRGIIALVFCYSLITHNSHFLIVLASLIALFIFNYAANLGLKKTLRQLLMLALVTLVLNLTFNYFKHKEFKLSRVAYTFLFARMLETGAIHKYVDDHKGVDDIVRNHINDIPQNSVEFLWNTDQSILYSDSCLPKKGWEVCWCEKDPLFKAYIKKVLLYSPSRVMYVKEIFKSLLRQLSFYKVEALGPLTTDYPVKINVKKYMKYDYPNYIEAMQYQRVLYFKLTNTILLYSTVLSIALLIFCGIYLKNKKLNMALLLFFVFYLFNAFICSSFSNTTERYTSRIAWIIPLFAIIAVMLLIKNVKEHRASKQVFILSK